MTVATPIDQYDSKAPKKRCHPESFLFPREQNQTPPLHSQSTKKNAVILSPFYPTRAKPNTTTIPSGDKKGEGSSRAFTSCKKPSAIKDRFLLGPRT
jgi:hypothetical protein